MQIVVLDGYAANPHDLSWAPMEELGQLTVYERTAPEEVMDRIRDAELVLTNKVVITGEMMEKLPRLSYIGVLATGYNVVDIPAARTRGIVVTNIPAYSTPSVVQHTFALLFELSSHVGALNAAVQAGRWSGGRDFCFWDEPLMELAGKTMGIVGYGRIGQGVAAVARALGMRVLIASGHAEGPEVVPLDTLLRKSDIVSLHCPLTGDNAGMMNTETIARMKDGAILINTARGGLLKETDVRAALDSGKLSGAAMDVAATEPIPADSPLLGHPRCILTPHVAWAPREARIRLMQIAVENVQAFLAGTPINNVASRE